MTIFGEERQLVRAAVEGAVVLRTIEAELDRAHSAHAQCERRKAEHYPDHDTGDEAPLDDYQRDSSERYVFDKREIPPRIEQPSIKQVQAAVEQQTAQDELRYVSEKAGAGRQYETRDGRDRQYRKPASTADLIIERGPAQGATRDVSAKAGRQLIGRTDCIEFAL